MTTAQAIRWSVFTKPWPDAKAEDLAAMVADLGFDGVELPIRPGFQVSASSLPHGLTELSGIFADHGLQIYSVASTLDEPLMAACAAVNVPVVRIMAPLSPNGFLDSDKLVRNQLDAALPLCERYGVQIGVQPHYDYYISDSLMLANLLADYDPRHVVAIWDAAHDGLARKAPEHGLEMVWPRLGMVNLKNAYYRREPDDKPAKGGWQPFFCQGPDGMADWGRALRYLSWHGYSGVICLTAEYDEESDLQTLVRDDLRYARRLIEERR